MTAVAEIETAVWVLIATNVFEALLGAIITGVSYYAYRTNRRKTPLRNATIGFGLITVGMALEPIYQLWAIVALDHAAAQNILVPIVEAVIISLGFAVLFLSIYTYSSRSRRQRITLSDLEDEFPD